MSPIFAGVAAFFSVAALVFYIIASCGYSKDRKVLKGCHWIYFEQNYDYFYSSIDEKVYFGLKGYYYLSSDPALSGSNKFYYYGSSDEYYSLNECDESGKSAFWATIIACIFSFISAITNGVGGVSEAKVVKAVSAVLSIIACLSGIIAVGVFMSTCFDKIYNDASYTSDLYYGNGSILAITALIFNFFAFILAIVNIIVGVGHIPLANQE